MILSLIATMVHALLNICLGQSLLFFIKTERAKGETLYISLLSGMYMETLIIFFLSACGFKLRAAMIFLTIFTFLLFFYTLYKRRERLFSIKLIHFTRFSLKWYEVIILLLIAEKLFFSLWTIFNTPLYFDDALTHWSGRGRAFYGEVNWSFDPNSNHFLGFTGHKHYPLMLPVWRSVSALINNGWNDVIARADGILFYFITIASVWYSVWNFSKTRWLSGVAAYIVSAFPLLNWHVTAGFADLAVGSFATASLAAIFRKEWFIAGIFAAGTCWAKNDGLLLHIPSLFLLSLLLQSKWSDRLKDGGYFLLGLLTISPWLIYKIIFIPGITPGGEGFSWHINSLDDFRSFVVMGATHSIFWIFFLALFLLSVRDLFKNHKALQLSLFMVSSLSTVFFVFTFTDAYIFLLNEMTVHRTMLQFYGTATIVLMFLVYVNNKIEFDKNIEQSYCLGVKFFQKP